MALTYTVRTVFTADDEMGLKISSSAKSVEKLGASAEQAQGSVGKFLASGAKGALAFAGAMAGAAVAFSGISAAFAETTALETALVSAGTKFNGIIKKGSTAYGELEAAAKAASATGLVSATDAAKGLENLGAAGLTAGAAVGSLNSVIALAAVAGVSLDQASSMASDAVGALGLEAANDEQYVASLNRVIDSMSVVADMTTASLSDVSEALTEAGPVAKAYGVSVEQTSGALALFAAAGLKGSRAGTAFKNAVLSLSQQTGPAAKLMKQYGIHAARAADGGVDLIGTIANLAKATKGMDTIKKNDLIAQIVGKESVAAVLGLLNKSEEEFRAFSDAVGNSAGSAATKYEVLSQTTDSAMGKMKNGFVAVGTAIMSGFTPVIESAAGSTGRWLGEVGGVLTKHTELRDELIGGVSTAIQGVGLAIAGAIGIYLEYRAVTATVVAWQWLSKLSMAALKWETIWMTAATWGARAAMFALGLAIVPLQIAIGIWNGIVAAATVVQWAFNAALAGTFWPILLVIAVLGLLVAAGVYLYKNWDVIWQGIKNTVTTVVDFIMAPINMLLKALGMVSSGVAGLGGAGAKVNDAMNGFGPQNSGVGVTGNPYASPSYQTPVAQTPAVVPGSAGVGGGMDGMMGGQLNVMIQQIPGFKTLTEGSSLSSNINVQAPDTGGL